MKILVTGASGFVGRVFCERAEAAGHAVRRVFRRADQSEDACFVGDLASTQDWSAAFVGVEAVVHLAARVHQMRENPKEAVRAYQQINVDATRRLVQQAAEAGVKRFIFISSIKVNGERTVGGALTENDEPAPCDLYGRSKWLAEKEVREHAEALDMEWTIIRPPLVYGAGVGGNFERLMGLVKRGVPLPLGRMRARRSYVNVWNLVDLILLCCEHPAASRQVFLAEDATLTTSDLVKRIGQAMGARARLLPVPRWLMTCGEHLPVVGAAVSRLTGELEVSAEKARTMLGWRPAIDLDEGLRRTVSRYLNPPED
ncbi:NAD-dependent epimerase/dehydratase family protein [Uliginosibacterium sp. 31-16]|uniref:NAD-dependent epimerase/dehydratase family protein n=1 Tax=Uliginosibacterium sp. 31-16 TaxID=3068315 RepID=UPI0027402669|nr:NAD-dependent epimerase/dehydratase family protein [Uliginosibacterium sp. 31-16]MDP5238376.1 NAD-dependent epimerase/dehydratase family protein [Uliginosibacterium sp. 31-16]